VLHVQVGGRDEGVEPGAGGDLDSPPGLLDVVPGGARQRRDHRPPDLARHGVHRPEVVLTGHRKAGLDDVHPEEIQLARHPDFILEVHAAARRLLSVAQRRVENRDSVGHGVSLDSEVSVHIRGGMQAVNRIRPARSFECRIVQRSDSGRFRLHFTHSYARPETNYILLTDRSASRPPGRSIENL